MRPLKLQTTAMTGPDVSDWQMFLKSKGLLQGIADGQFGPRSDAATRAYQNSAGLSPDGVVGATTIARAVADGYQSTTGANLAGMDANINCLPFAGQLSASGIQFVARYYSDNPHKTLTTSEAAELSRQGIDIVTVFEDSNNSSDLFSTASGHSHASKAIQIAASIGQPAGAAIYFAVDFDPSPADVQGPVSDYLRAINDVMGAAQTQYVVGVYGSGLTCRVIRDAGLARFTWLTCSTGFREYLPFRRQADIVQLAPERGLFSGLTIDDDIAQSNQFGAFRIAQALTATGMPT
jgi:peptidoglycan hydrolase-like protein with peptidoglycan-binding domain